MSLSPGAQCVICGGSFAVWDSERDRGGRGDGGVCGLSAVPAYGGLQGAAPVGGGEGTEGKEKTGGDDTQGPRDDEGEPGDGRFWYVVCFWVVLIGLILLSLILGCGVGDFIF